MHPTGPPTTTLTPGMVFAGHRIDAVAGRGGMGVVYKVTQLALERTVALKVIAPQLLQDEEIRRRFIRESKIAASIDHPHVIPIYYTGEDSGVAYIAMRYVDGDDLRSLIRREGRLDPWRAAYLVAQVAAALDAAHAAGLVHRDVKPANVLLGPGEHAYLTDFGLTKHALSVAGTTEPGQWVGTLDYVAPEQVRGERVEARADVYSLGGLLYFALTGKVPFPSELDEAKLWAHLTQPAPLPTAAVPELSEAFDRIVERAMAKAPADRYPSAGDLGRAAVAAARGDAVIERERVVGVGAAAPLEAATRTAVTTLRLESPDTLERRDPTPVPTGRSRRSWAALALAAAALLVAGGAARAVLFPADDPPPSSAQDRAAREPTATATVAPRPRRVATIPVGSRPNTLALTDGTVWVGSFASSKLRAIDPATNRVDRSMAPTVGIGASDLAASGRSLWMTVSRSQRLVRIDARSGRHIGGPVALSGWPQSVTARRDVVWVGMSNVRGVENDGRVVRIDPRTGRTVATHEIPAGVAQVMLAPNGLWVLTRQPAQLTRINQRTGEPLRVVHLPSGDPVDLIYAEGALWATMSDPDYLLRIDPHDGARAEIEMDAAPAGVAVRNGIAWLALSGASQVARVNTANLRTIGRPINVPFNPHAIAASGDGVWVTCVGPSVVVRIEEPS
jgi:streptogramin lyase